MRRRILFALVAGVVFAVATVGVGVAAPPDHEPCSPGWTLYNNTDDGPQLGDRNGDEWYCEKDGIGNGKGGNQNANRVNKAGVTHGDDNEANAGENHKDTHPHWTP